MTSINPSALHYAARAQDYVTSAVHAQGADLDQVEALVRGRGFARVLDLGCGGGHVSYRAAPHVGEVVACDITASMLEAVAATAASRGIGNITTQQTAAETLPFPDAFFDAVLCRFTCHHWLDWEAGLREARRMLKSGAPALFIDVVSPANPLFDTHFQAIELLRDLSHVRNQSVAAWTAALARADFAVTGLTMRTLRMEFASWTERTHTPVPFREAIRALQVAAPESVRRHFAIDGNGNFDLESAAFEMTAV